MNKKPLQILLSSTLLFLSTLSFANTSIDLSIEQKDRPKATANPTRINEIQNQVKQSTITLIDLDHDAGDYANDGGDYIRLLDWLEETGRNYPIRIHSMNPVGVQNMRAIIQKNSWQEIK